MELPLQVSFRQMERSADVEAAIRDKAAKLNQFASRITSCRVMVQPAGKHRERGQQYQVNIDITLPGGEIAISKVPGEHEEYQDLAVAIRDAFDSAGRQLEDFVRRQRMQ